MALLEVCKGINVKNAAFFLADFGYSFDLFSTVKLNPHFLHLYLCKPLTMPFFIFSVLLHFGQFHHFFSKDKKNYPKLAISNYFNKKNERSANVNLQVFIDKTILKRSICSSTLQFPQLQAVCFSSG